jgi:putative transposase
LLEEHQASIQRACRVVQLPKSMWYYEFKRDDSEVIAKLNELAEKHHIAKLMNIMEDFV